MTEDYKKTIAEMEKCMSDIDNMVRVRLEQADSIRGDVSDYEKGVIEMRRLANKLDEINQPKKRWYEYLGVKPVPRRFTFEIKDRPTFTEQELAERRAFLDGFDAGRTDGDAHTAYKLWRKLTGKTDEH